jgi:nitrate/nitrite transport system ATP-binding protein
VAPVLQVENVDVGFGTPDRHCKVLSNINLTVNSNEFLAVIGFSGSGKSTLLNLLSGLQRPDCGEVRMNGKLVGRSGLERGILFQSNSLLPWLSVFGNIELAVRQVFPDMNRSERVDHIQRCIDMVALTGSEWKKPQELSGGMRQRLSLARTMSMRPDLLLLDEPLSALDALTRANLQDEIMRVWEEDRRTVVLITNDVEEAVLMADRVVALTPGPGATLGRSFEVPLARPRDRTTLNLNPEFQMLRSDVTNYLMEINQVSGKHRNAEEITDPSPVDSSAA